MTRYVTVANVRALSGAPESLASEDDVNQAIDMSQAAIAKYLNMKFEPTLAIDIMNGNGKDNIFVENLPLLTLRALKIDGTSETVSALHVSHESGNIKLGEDSTSGVFTQKAKAIQIKYYHGYVEEDNSVSTTSSAATTAGTAVAISVASHVGFATDDWVYVYGMDGYKEAAKISSATGNVITVDELLFSHEIGTIVVKLDVPDFLRSLIETEAALYVAIHAIGSTYTFAASYTIRDFSIVKGVPYTHWRESTEKLMKQRNYLRKSIKPRISMY